MLLCTYANKHTRLASVPDALLFRVVTLQVMVQCTVPVPDKNVTESSKAATVREALQAAGQATVDNDPVGQADTPAVHAVEMHATGWVGNVPGGRRTAGCGGEHQGGGRRR
jgi:hypothetical protein